MLLLTKRTPVVAGECEEVDVTIVVCNSTFGSLVRHANRLTDLGRVAQPPWLGAAGTGFLPCASESG